MKSNILFDAHCDTIEKMLDENLTLDSDKLSVNLKQAKCNLPYIQCLATFIHDMYNKKSYGIKRAEIIINNFYKEFEKYKDNIFIIKNAKDMESKKLGTKWGILLTIENAGAMGTSLDNIDKMYNRGIRIMSITWNGRNRLGCGAFTKCDTGLTNLGKKYIKKMEKRKVGIDVSHLSYKSFWDVCNITTCPIIATHSCCNSICNNKRNLTDNQIKEIAKRDGVIGINYCNLFLNNSKESSSKDIVNHIEHIVNLVGINFVGLGSDFDGIDKENEPVDIHTVSDVKNIQFQLEKRGFSKEEIRKIMGENWRRALKLILPY